MVTAKPVIAPPPTRPSNIEERWNRSIGLTAVETAYYDSVCERFEDESAAEVEADTGFTRSDACEWRAYCYNPDIGLERETLINDTTLYIELLERYGIMLLDTIDAVTEEPENE